MFEKNPELIDAFGYDNSEYKIRSENNIINFDDNNKPLEFYYKLKDNANKLEEAEKNRNKWKLNEVK